MSEVKDNDWKFSYEGCQETDIAKVPTFEAEENGEKVTVAPIRYKLQKPADADGNLRDQTGDAAKHMKLAHSLGLQEVSIKPTPRMGRAVIVGGAPSINDNLEHIRKLASDPENAVFAINWSHTWLIEQGIIPKGCVFFEIDAEPDSVLEKAHPDVTYYICSHCHPKTFDSLADHKRMLWHSPPNSEGEKVVAEELFPKSTHIGGGIGTFTRTLSIALALGYRNLELFGVDGSFPDDSESTHVKGYQTANDVRTDAFYVYAVPVGRPHSEGRRFKTVGYLALQVDEFQEYCRINHQNFALRVHGDGLLRFAHKSYFPDQYEG